MKRRLLVGTSLALVLVSAVAANAAWTKPGTGNGKAQARSLADVASPGAAKLTGTSIRVSWTAVPNPTGTRYKVVRSSGPGSPATVCATASVSPCDDTSLGAGTYTYTVQTVLPATNWIRTAVSAGSITLTATTVTSCSPTTLQKNGTRTLTVNGTGFNTSDAAVAVSGVTAANLSVTGRTSTSLTVSVTLASNASQTARDVTVSSVADSTTATKTSCFSVTS